MPKQPQKNKTSAELNLEKRHRTRRRLTIRGVLSFFIVLTFVRAAFMHRYENMFVCVLSLVLFCVPMMIERSLDIDIPPVMEGIIYCFIFAAEILGEKGIFVAIEPLCKKECNFLNTVKETFDLLQSLPEGPKGINCDFYHAGQENESLSVLNRAGSLLRHCHIAHPVTRKAPLPDDGADYQAIFQALKDCGYDGTISFEGDWENNPALLQASAAFLKKTAEEVSGIKAI